MKRTLLETLAGLAVLVLLASFHHQLSRLKADQDNVANLRQMVQQAVSKVDASSGGEQQRQRLLSDLHTKISALEGKLAEASAQGAETHQLRQELDATRQAADLFRDEIERDVSRTRELVDAYHREVKSIDRTAQDALDVTRSTLKNLSDQVHPDPLVLDRCVLGPTVQLNGDDTVGSGTLVYSQANPQTQKVESYVITSYHVIRNILADTASARRDGISVTIYDGDKHAEDRGDMVGHDERIDAALLKLRSETRYANVARIAPRSRSEAVRVWERVYTVGCPLGNDPIPTQGEIASVRNQLGNANYWMINAPTYFGNSGGGVYLADTRELIGVFSKIYTHGKGNPVVVPHMGLCTPLDAIYDWLTSEKLDFVVAGGDAIDPTQLAAPPK